MGSGIGTWDCRTPQIDISSEKQSDSAWKISVCGIGMDMRYADKIFKPFVRLHSQGEYEGTGIGLAICNKFVMRYGGRMWVEAELGKGSAFHFSLPSRQAPQFSNAA